MKREDLLQENLEGKVWFIEADTMAGLSCLAKDEAAVERVTKIKQRDLSKVGYIVLIDSVERIEEFGIYLSSEEKELMNRVWPGQYTIVTKTVPTKFQHVTSINESVGFRVPDDEGLLSLLREIGPMVSTSCNRSGSPAITDVEEARVEFGDEIDHYVLPERNSKRPSTIIKIIR